MLFFFNDTATTEIYTLSLHDALPICIPERFGDRLGNLCFVSGHALYGEEPHQMIFRHRDVEGERSAAHRLFPLLADRKSTRLNSSHANISYAVFCLKKNQQSLCRH